MGKQKHFVCEFFRILLKEGEEEKKKIFHTQKNLADKYFDSCSSNYSKLE